MVCWTGGNLVKNAGCQFTVNEKLPEALYQVPSFGTVQVLLQHADDTVDLITNGLHNADMIALIWCYRCCDLLFILRQR